MNNQSKEKESQHPSSSTDSKSVSASNYHRKKIPDRS